MDKFEAERHFQSAPIFDYGYSPEWHIREEINCEFIKGKETNVQTETKEEEEVDFVPSS